MTDEKLILELNKAARRWDENNPVVPTFEIRYSDALREAAQRISDLSVELKLYKNKCLELSEKLKEPSKPYFEPLGGDTPVRKEN